MKSINKQLSFTLLAVAFGSVLYKAINVPATHDEVATLIYYSKFSWLDLFGYIDGSQNNHLLNTLLVKLFYSFGKEGLLIGRLPNVIAFTIYSLGCYRICHEVIGLNSKAFSVGLLLFIFNPYLLDFFSLSRGYGISVAFVSLSISHLIPAMQKGWGLNSIYSIVFGFLASLASFPTLIFSAAIVSLIGFRFFCHSFNRISRNQFLYFVVIILLCAEPFILPIINIHKTNQYVYFKDTGYIHDTFISLIRLSMYGSKIFITSWSVFILLFAFFLINLFEIIRRNQHKEMSGVFVIHSLIIVIIVINLIQIFLLKTPHLQGRTSLFLYPVLISVILSSYPVLSRLFTQPLKWIMVTLVVVFGIHHTFHTWKSYSVLEWEYDQHTIAMLDELKSINKNSKSQIAVNWLFHPSVSFHVIESEWLELAPYSKILNPSTSADFLYLAHEESDDFSEKYEVIKTFTFGVLLKRKSTFR